MRLKLFEEYGEHCDVVKKFMKYFSSKRMNKLSWWIDPFHLPQINDMICDSVSVDEDGYRFGPWASKDSWIRNVPKEQVSPSIRNIMDKVDCDYITFCTTSHNYGTLMGYNKKGMRYSKSLDPDDVDKDEFAQQILETLVDQNFIIDEDVDKMVEYEKKHKEELFISEAEGEGEKYNL